MGLFRRIRAVIRGFLSLFVSRVEEMSPEALMQDVSYQIDKAKREAERQIIDLQTSAELIKIENDELGKKASDINVKMIRAKEAKDLEILAMLICEKDDCGDVIKENTDIYKSVMKEVDVLKAEYKYFVLDMGEKIAELKKLKSQAKMTDIKTNINSLRLEFSNRSKSTENMRNSLDRVKEIINQRTAKSNAIFSFNQDNLVNNSFAREERTVRLEKARSIAQNMLKDTEVERL